MNELKGKTTLVYVLIQSGWNTLAGDIVLS